MVRPVPSSSQKQQQPDHQFVQNLIRSSLQKKAQDEEKADPLKDCCPVHGGIICACVPKPKKIKCKSDTIRTNEIVVCEKALSPQETDEPHTFFPIIKRCDRSIPPEAPIVLPAGEGPSFNVLGSIVTLKAGAFDTRQAEIAQILYPPKFSTPPLINYASDQALTVISGNLDININGTNNTLGEGGFVYIKKGSGFSITNVGDTNALLSAVFIGPGTLGYFNEVSTYQTAVGGSANVDTSVVEEIGKKYCIFPVPGTLGPSSGAPGTIGLLPSPKIKGCPGGSWGLKCNQYLVVSVTPTPDTLPVGGKPSVTIRPKDPQAMLVLDPTTVTATLQARLVRDPDTGIPEILACPTINEADTFELNTATKYWVFYDSCQNNVIVQPITTTVCL
jgi:mannose-6-phosphate isomerase-like protein (cupin superfamily)